MASEPFNVLFLCTGNSARSIMAESILNFVGRPKFKAYSAGSHPAGSVNPFALAVIEKNRLSTAGLRSKDWNEFSGPARPSCTLYSRSATRRRRNLARSGLDSR